MASLKTKAAAGAAVVALAVVSHPSVATVSHNTPPAPSANIVLGQELADQKYHWINSEWRCLDILWTGESGWRNHADTRATGLDTRNAVVFAYGIPQARPATKLPLAGRPASLGGKSSPRAQIIWGLRYIDLNYGSPCVALAAKRASGNKGY